MKPLLTIAIPTYNRSRYLARSLDNILRQVIEVDPDGSLIEILVSDNSSDDNTVSVVKEYLQRFPNIRYNRNSKNLGPDGNFLKCILLSNGIFTHILGDDDLLLPGALTRIVSTVHENQTTSLIMINGYRIASPEFRHTSEGLIFKRPSTVTHFHDPESLFKSIRGSITFTSSMIFNTEILRSISDLSEGMGTQFIQDFWIFKLLKKNPESVTCPYAWISQGDAETNMMNEINPNGEIIGNVTKDSLTLMHLQLFSVHVPELCRKLGYKRSLSRSLLSRYIFNYSLNILYNKIKGNPIKKLENEYIYKYTKKRIISWGLLYPVLLTPESLVMPFRGVVLRVIFKLI